MFLSLSFLKRGWMTVPLSESNLQSEFLLEFGRCQIFKILRQLSIKSEVFMVWPKFSFSLELYGGPLVSIICLVFLTFCFWLFIYLFTYLFICLFIYLILHSVLYSINCFIFCIYLYFTFGFKETLLEKKP